jgi:hypothetical protein
VPAEVVFEYDGNSLALREYWRDARACAHTDVPVAAESSSYGRKKEGVCAKWEF